MIQYFSKFPILKRLIPSVGIRVMRFFNKNRGYFKIGNINFYLDFLDPIDRQIIIYKKYEDDQVLFLEGIIKRICFDYFLDIGANCGYYSFYFANKFKNLNIKAFEPNIDAYKKLRNTLEKNLFLNIEIFNFGLSDFKKKVQMFCIKTHNHTHSNSQIFKKSDNYDLKNCKVFQANMEKGDDLMNCSNKKLIFKIDVEKHEIFTLKGLIKNLRNNKCIILIEIADSRFKEVNYFLHKINFYQIFKSKYRSDYIFSNFNILQ